MPETLAALRGQSRVPDQFVAIDAGSTDDTASIFRTHLPESAVFLEAPAGGFGLALTAAADHLPAPDPDIQDWLWLQHDDAAPVPNALAVLLEAVERSPAVVIAGCKQLEAGRERALLDVGLSVTRHAERMTMLELDEQDQGQHDGTSDVFAVNSAGLLVRLDVWRELQGFDPSLPFTGDDVDLAWRARAAGHRVIVVPQARMIHEPLGVKIRTDRTAQRRAASYLRLKHAPTWTVPFVAIAVVLGGFGRLISGIFAKDPAYGFGQFGASWAPLWHPIKLAQARRLAKKTRKVPRSVISRAFADPSDVAHIRRRNRDLYAARAAAEAVPTESELANGAGLTPGAAELANATGGNDDFEALDAPAKPSLVPAAAILSILTLVLSLVGLRHVLGASSLVGGSLLPISTNIQDLWNNVASWWQPDSLGVPAAGDPFDALLLTMAAISGDHANIAAVTLYLGAMMLAGWTALWFTRAVTSRIFARFLVALLWAVHPVLIVALSQGRPGAVLAHITLPVLAGLLFQALGIKDSQKVERHKGARVASRAGAALAMALVAVGSPVTAVFVVAVVLVAAVIAVVSIAFGAGSAGSFSKKRNGEATNARNHEPSVLKRVRALWWTPLPTLVVFAPLVVQWFTQRAAHEDFAWSQAIRELLLDPGAPQAFDPAPLWQQVLGFPLELSQQATLLGVPVLVIALVIGAPLLLTAVAALFVPKLGGNIARYSVLVGLLALACSATGALVTVALDRGSVVVPFNGPLVSVLTLALVTAAATLLNHESAPAVRRVSAALVAVSVLAAGTVFLAPRIADPANSPSADVAAGDLTALGASQAVIGGREALLPATAADRGRGEFEERTLVIETAAADDSQTTTPAVSARLMNRGGDTLDSISAAHFASALDGSLIAAKPSDASTAETEVRNVVASIMTGNSSDVRETLAGLGVSFVAIDGIVDVTDPLLSRVRAVPGLTEVGDTAAGWLWRVAPLDGAVEATGQPAASTANVRVLNRDGSVAQFVPSTYASVSGFTVPAGEANRVVVMAQERDAAWQATVNGQNLERAVNVPGVPAWAQAFTLPEDGGTLEITYASPWRIPVFIGGGLVLLMVLLLAIPLPKRQLARLSEDHRYRPENAPEEQADAPASKEA
ncbi:GT2 family glycosyltransferase [Neomicrococcus aestuarii]|uniref:GT2 family glycosyltransferase n=1 Tax=Neomicrococcus aestuarii TaxID=556325 RepID=A0A7W8X059_9MICC|nr:GT2 family glycosyltransferase [Neomicrococcus aestuarii]